MKFLNVILLLGLVTVAACSDTPSMHYFQLQQAPVVNAPAAGSATLVVENVIVADFLDSNALVLQKSNVELVRTQQQQWVEPLGGQLSRNLRAELQRQLPEVQVLSQATRQNQPRLMVQVEQFHGSEQGQVFIKVRYSLMYKGKVQPFEYQWQQAQPAEGYASLVETLSNGWQQVGQQIASQIKELVGKK